jgi:hypothetical protein
MYSGPSAPPYDRDSPSRQSLMQSNVHDLFSFTICSARKNGTGPIPWLMALFEN